MALIGTHTIGYRDEDGGTLPVAEAVLPVQVEFFEPGLVHDKLFGTDAWELQVGPVLRALLADASSKCPPAPGLAVRVFGLHVVRFRKGLFQWSRHRIEIAFHYEVWAKGGKIAEGLVSEQAEGCGREFGLGVYIPIAGNAHFDRGIELAMSRCLQACVTSLAVQLQKAGLLKAAPAG